MTKAQLLAAVGGIGDDLVTRCTPEGLTPATDDTRVLTPRTNRQKTRRRITAAVAACLLVAFLSAIYVQIDLNYFTAACGGSPGTIAAGRYYYYNRNAGYFAYDPATGESELLVSKLFRDLEGGRVNEYGFYYTALDSHHLKVRVHETGETVTLYEADFDAWTHTGITELYEETLLYTLYNKDRRYRTILLLDAVNGEVLETVADRLPYGVENYTIPYPVGDRNIGKTTVLDKTTLRHITEDGEPLLLDGQYLGIGDAMGNNLYAGDSLIAGYWKNGTSTGGQQFALIRPDGRDILIDPAFEVFGGTNDYLFGRLYGDERSALWMYDITTGQTAILIEHYTMQEITTDGTYLFATAPWSHTTEVYRLDYAEGGTLLGVTLIDTIGD